MRVLAIVLGAFVVAAGSPAQTLSVHIESGKSRFQIGEAIGLTVTFEMNDPSQASPPNLPGWMTTLNAHDRTVLSIGRDRFVVSPETGTRDPWEYRLHGGFAYSGPGGSHLSAKPTVLEIDLNQWVRFERAGHYTVYLHSKVTGPQHQDVEIQSNEIGIDILPADPAWEAEELAKDISALNATQGAVDSRAFEQRMGAARHIADLDTPAAVREMARRLGTADIQSAQILADGLRSSGHGGEAMALMNELLHDPAEPVTPIFLRTLAGLDERVKDPQKTLAGVIGQKQGAAKAISIKTLLDGMPDQAAPPELQSEIARLFPELPASQQSELLDYQWNKIESPEMIPVLREIYEKMPETMYPENPLFASAAGRLYELDTNGTRTLLIEEMKRRVPRLPYKVLAMLPDATLPDLDATFLDSLQHNGAAAELIARYATKSILDPVKDYYAKRDAEMKSRVTDNPNVAAPVCEPPLVAYFLRVEPGWGEQVIRQSIAERSYPMGRCWLSIIGRTAVYYSGPAWEKVAIESLQDAAVPVKTDAVRALGRYGSPESKSAVFGAFRQWHQWWENRGEPNDENRILEQALVQATTRPANWKPSGSDLAMARELCLSTGCKSQVPAQAGN